MLCSIRTIDLLYLFKIVNENVTVRISKFGRFGRLLCANSWQMKMGKLSRHWEPIFGWRESDFPLSGNCESDAARHRLISLWEQQM